jgi:hypothetical protein
LHPIQAQGLDDLLEKLFKQAYSRENISLLLFEIDLSPLLPLSSSLLKKGLGDWEL